MLLRKPSYYHSPITRELLVNQHLGFQGNIIIYRKRDIYIYLLSSNIQEGEEIQMQMLGLYLIPENLFEC